MKKFVWSGVAVVFALVLALGLIGQSAFAATAVTPGALTPATATAGASTTYTFNAVGSAATALTSATVTFPTAFTVPGVPTVTVTGDGVACAIAGDVAAGGVVTINIGAAPVCASDVSLKITVAGVTAPAGTYTASTTQSASAGFAVATSLDATPAAETNGVVVSAGSGTCTGGLCVDGFVLTPAGATCNEAAIDAGQNPANNIDASGLTAYSLCVHVSTASTNNIATPATFKDALDTPANGSIVTLSVSLGLLSTGTSKTTTLITNPTGYASTNYRGGGNQTATDSAVASAKLGSLSAAGTLAINLIPGTGGTPAKMVFTSPVTSSLGQKLTAAPGYVPPTFGTDIALQVTDASGLGVNSQVILVTVDKGTLAVGFNAVCGTSKSVTPTTATGALTAGGTAVSGVVQMTWCSSNTDAAGKMTITAQEITTTMANATASITQAGAPAKITATATGNTVNVMVVDAGGNPVSDGTPVRFAIGAFAGATTAGATGCATTSDGAASTVVALTQPTGTVAVSTDWNETGGVASSCTASGGDNEDNPTSASAGSQSLATSVTVPSGSSSAGGTPPAAGTVTSGSIPANGGFGLIVYGGPITDLPKATGCPVATSAFWATINGNFVTYVPGTTISAVNADFKAAFPNGIPAGTPLIGKCV